MEVFITPSYLQGKKGLYLSRLEAAGFTPHFAGDTFQLRSDADRIERLRPYKYVICGIEIYTPEILAALSNLTLLSRAGVGIDNIDVDAATKLGIAVTNVPDGNSEAVAEYTVAAMLALCRNIIPLHQLVTSGGWTREPTPVFRYKTLGLWGYGKIAQLVAQYASAFQVEVIAHSRSNRGNGARFVSWDELLAKSDFLSVHVPLAPETEGKLDYESLCKMKPTAYLVNTARGKIIPTQDLVRALTEKRIAGAALDVFEEEPLRNNPYAGFSNVILTPHLSGIDVISIDTLATGASENVISLCKEKKGARNLLNPQVMRTWRNYSSPEL